MSTKIILLIVGLLGVLLFWIMFRTLIKEGSIQTEIPFLFLLSNEYRSEKE